MKSASELCFRTFAAPHCPSRPSEQTALPVNYLLIEQQATFIKLTNSYSPQEGAPQGNRQGNMITLSGTISYLSNSSDTFLINMCCLKY